jgi:hypothetical protein
VSILTFKQLDELLSSTASAVEYMKEAKVRYFSSDFLDSYFDI